MRRIVSSATIAFGMFCLAGCSNAIDPTLQTASLRVVEPGDNTLSCTDLKKQIAAMDTKVTELNVATRDSTVNDALSSSMSSTAVSQAYAGPNAEIFGPLQSALASVGSASRQNDMSQLRENLSNAKARRDYLTGIHNQRCF